MSALIRSADVGRHPRAQRLFAVFGVLLAAGTVGLLVGPLGALVAVAAGVAGYLFGAAVAFAVGQVVLVALFPPAAPIGYFVLGEAGLCLVLLGGLLNHAEPIRSVAATLVVSAAVGGGTWFVFWSTESIPVTGGVLLVGIAVAVYVGHRYERVRLGLVERE